MATLDTGDTAFVLACMGLVQLMTPGLAFFYGGLVRSTNILTLMMQSFLALGFVFVLWYMVVFSLSFGESIGGIVGDPSTFAFFQHVSVHAPLTLENKVLVPSIPGLLFAGYQGMFAVITPALMTGAFADRFRAGPYMLFVCLWMTAIYGPVCHWVWGGGWMMQWGVWDFAGGIVVHTTSGFSALASVVFLGRRHVPEDGPETLRQPHNVPFVALGTALLWFGWFGFNGGSALASNGVATLAAINSQIAGSTAMIGWLAIDTIMGKTPGLVSACVGAVAGLATVTPAAGYIQTWGALLIGVLAPVVCYPCVEIMSHLGIDDALDVWGVHGMSGFVGIVLVGFLADGVECAETPTDAVPLLDCANPGTVTRSANQVFVQLSCAVIVAVYSSLVSLFLLWAIDKAMGIRPRKSEEGDLDRSQHGEIAYVTHKNSVNLMKTDMSESGLLEGGVASSESEDDANQSVSTHAERTSFAMAGSQGQRQSVAPSTPMIMTHVSRQTAPMFIAPTVGRTVMASPSPAVGRTVMASPSARSPRVQLNSR